VSVSVSIKSPSIFFNSGITAGSVGSDSLDKIIVALRKVVAYFHRSPLATGILKEKQKLLLPPEFQGHKLIQDVVTRWNSTLDMLERLMEQAPRPSHSFYGTEHKESN
jgi:hypothetical protein